MPDDNIVDSSLGEAFDVQDYPTDYWDDPITGASLDVGAADINMPQPDWPEPPPAMDSSGIGLDDSFLDVTLPDAADDVFSSDSADQSWFQEIFGSFLGPEEDPSLIGQTMSMFTDGMKGMWDYVSPDTSSESATGDKNVLEKSGIEIFKDIGEIPGIGDTFSAMAEFTGMMTEDGKIDHKQVALIAALVYKMGSEDKMWDEKMDLEERNQVRKDEEVAIQKEDMKNRHEYNMAMLGIKQQQVDLQQGGEAVTWRARNVLVGPQYSTDA